MTSPPDAPNAYRPRAHLRVGVTGHRPGPKLPPETEPAVSAAVQRLFAALARDLGAIAAAHADAFAAAPPQLVVISSLAEGADRIVAERGLEAGATLEVVLPAPRAEYETDFEDPASKAGYQALLARATSVFELEATPGALGGKRGYEAAGLVMLAHTDLLIAIWDEGEPAGIGGTGAIVEHAVNEGCPVMLINPAAPDTIRLLWTGDAVLPPAKVRLEQLADRDGLAATPDVVATLVAPPPLTSVARTELDAFYDEPMGRTHGWPVYSIFLAALGVRPLRRSDFGPAALDTEAGERWRGHFPRDHGDDGLTHAVRTHLLPAVTRCDAQAVRYGEFYRSAFVFNYLAAALTVTLALIGLAPELPWMHNIIGNSGSTVFKAFLVSFELVLIVMIMWVWRKGASRQWHRRWLDYRRLAENLRHLRILTLVGSRSPAPRPRKLLEHELTKPDWVEWLVRANERMLPLPNRPVDNAYVTAVRTALTKAELDDQIDWNAANAHRMMHAEHRLHAAGYVLFATPALVCLGFLVAYIGVDLVQGSDITHQLRFYVTQLSAVCPSFGAALNAIRMQGDFDSVARRSAATQARLKAIRFALHEPGIDFARLADLVQKTAETLGADVAEWRTLFSTRPLSLPA
ncbi:MAG TPA: hypothetical protein VKU90_04550 [Caulobacteraceae bacterium]|nr:hypothetical protein [Caulobacteraceae bacterium]